MASRPARSFTAALGIAVGIATVLSVQVIDRNTILTQERLAQQQALGRPDVEIRPLTPGVPEGGAAPLAFAGDRDLEAFCGLFFGAAEWARPGAKGEARPIEVAGAGPQAASVFAAYEVAEGRDLAGPGADEVLIAPSAAEELGLKVGEKIALRRATPIQRTCQGGQWVEKTLAAPATAPRDFTIVGRVTAAGLGAQPRLIVPFESGAALFADAPLLPLWFGKLRERAAYQDLRERLKQSFIVEKPKGSLVGERIDQRAFRKSLRVTSALALLLGLFVIYNAFSMALVERVREIGLLRALGLKRGEIARAVLLEGVLLAFGGALLGLLLSAGLVAFMAGAHITTLGAGKPIVIAEIPWGLAAAIAALGMAAALLGMAAPLLRARHLNVLDALRAGSLALRSDPGFSLRVGTLLGVPLAIPLLYELSTPPLGDRQSAVEALVLGIAAVVGAFFVLLLAFPRPVERAVEGLLRAGRGAFPVEARLAESAVRGARRRVQGTLAGLAVVVAAVFVVRAVNDSFLDEAARFTQVALRDRVYVQNRSLTRAEAERVLTVPGVARIAPLSLEVKAPFPVRALDAAALRAEAARAGIPPSAVEPFARGESVILSEFLAREYEWRVGDPVTLATFQGPRTFRVGAISDALGYAPDDRSFALVETGVLANCFCVDVGSARAWELTLGPGADGDAVERALLQRLPPAPDLKVRSARTLAAFYRSDGRRDFYVFDVILACTAALAGVGLLNSLAIALLERRREIGILRTVGLTTRQVGRMLLLEAGALGLVGGLLATALAWPVGALAVSAVRTISRLDLRFAPDAGTAAGPLLGCLALALLAALPPALRGGRLDLAPLHRHD